MQGLSQRVELASPPLNRGWFRHYSPKFIQTGRIGKKQQECRHSEPRGCFTGEHSQKEQRRAHEQDLLDRAGEGVLSVGVVVSLVSRY